ncbi:MAG: protein translocase subunit SecF, partial [Sphingomonadales bacterium]
TLIALGSLYIFGGAVIRGFTFAMIWGIVIGTYSSIFVAAPMLLAINPRDQTKNDDEIEKTGGPVASTEQADKAGR